MADVGAPDPEDHVFGDVGGVVGGALEVAGDDDGAEGLAAEDGVLLHDGDEFGLDGAVEVVDLVVEFEDRLGQLGVGFEQRLDGAAHHDADLFAHVGDVDRKRDGREVAQAFGALGDVVCLVADALEVAVDFDDGEDEAEVDGHGLLLGEEVVGHLVDVALGGVDGGLDLPYVGAEAHVAGEVGFEGELERLLGEGGHGEELVLEGDELLLEVDARHGGGAPDPICLIL